MRGLNRRYRQRRFTAREESLGFYLRQVYYQLHPKKGYGHWSRKRVRLVGIFTQFYKHPIGTKSLWVRPEVWQRVRNIF